MNGDLMNSSSSELHQTSRPSLQMYNHNVFAVLTAHDQRNMASSAFKLVHNLKWFCSAKGGVANEPIIDSREPTPAVDENAQSEKSEDPNSGAADRLVIRFDLLSENLQNGIQFGTSENLCHILLGHRGTRGVSKKQCSITVDDNLKVWLHDYHSTHGSAIGQEGQHESAVRKKETWILAFEPGPADQFELTTIHLGNLVVRIQFPNHGVAHPDYVKNLRAFAAKCGPRVQTTAQVPNLGELSVKSEMTTQAATEAPTVGEQLIYYKRKFLGKGGFGEVHQVVKARDGLVFAAKTFKRSSNKRKGGEELPAWLEKIRREFTLMRDNPHPNVAQVFELQETPEPMIVMRYYPDKNIVDARINDEPRRISAFGHILEALSHLHAQGIVHRDLKPENFLVQLDPYFKVVIADFGLANVVIDDAWLKTFCGTLKYMAPEVFPGLSEGHGLSADVWSAGVIAIEWMFGIPKPPAVPTPEKEGRPIPQKSWNEWVEAWVISLLAKICQAGAGDPLIDILIHMVEQNPKKRWTAKKCLKQGFDTDIFKRRLADDLVVWVDYKDEQEEEEARAGAESDDLFGAGV